MRILMIYIEPAPYIVDLIRVLRQRYPAISLRVLYIHEALTQPWDAKLDDGVSELLPSSAKEAAKVLYRTIHEGDFDILHLAGWGHRLLLQVLLLGIVFGRTICVESDTQLPEHESRWKGVVKRLLYPLLFSRIAVFFPGGSRQVRYFRYYGVPARKIHLARMTVDVTSITSIAANIKKNREIIRQAMGIPEDACLLVFVGRLEDYKGISLLLDAFKQINNAGCCLLVVGDGSCRDKVEATNRQNERVIYLGRRDFAGVIEALAISDVAVVPSFFEPWGLVVNEAMAAGLPVIASDRVGCVDDLVKHGVTGLVFSSGDAKALGQALQTLARDSLLRKRLGQAGHELISHWRLEDEADILVSAWQEQMIP